MVCVASKTSKQFEFMIMDGATSNRQRDSQVSDQRPNNDEQNCKQACYLVNRLMANYQGYNEPSEQDDGDIVRIYSQELLPLVRALNEENSKLKEEKTIIAQ